MRLRRLLPEPGEAEIAAIADALELGDEAPADRPHVIANMVGTADGRATIGGRSGPIGEQADSELFHALRGRVDAVMVGAGTLRVERYGPLIKDDAVKRARAARGLEPTPLGLVVTRTLSLPLDIPLFQDPDSRILVFTPSEDALGECPAQVEVVRVAREAGPAAALTAARTEHGVRSVLCEGGPNLLGELVARDLLDELFLTLAPRLAGPGEALSILEGPALASPVAMRPVWAFECAGSLFLRYAIIRNGQADVTNP